MGTNRIGDADGAPHSHSLDEVLERAGTRVGGDLPLDVAVDAVRADREDRPPHSNTPQGTTA